MNYNNLEDIKKCIPMDIATGMTLSEYFLLTHFTKTESPQEYSYNILQGMRINLYKRIYT